MKFEQFAEVTFEAIGELVGDDKMTNLTSVIGIMSAGKEDGIEEETMKIASSSDDKVVYYTALMMYVSKKYLNARYPDMDEDTEIDTKGLVEELQKFVDEHPELEDTFKKFTKDL